MPSFDIVSEVNLHEVTNAVDQASREVSHGPKIAPSVAPNTTCRSKGNRLTVAPAGHAARADGDYPVA